MARPQNQKATCTEIQVNRKVPDFKCDLRRGHTEPHRDPRTGTRWRHPKLPRGIPKRSKA